jgi:hypothetical protein
MTHLLVIGSPGLDINDVNLESLGHLEGASVRVSMAACRSGVKVSLLCPRPDPIPKELYPFSNQLVEWIGPTIQPGHISDLKTSREMHLNCLPSDLSKFDGLHLTAMKDADHQQSILTTCRERGAKIISVGTCLKSIVGNIDAVRWFLENSDVFFLNEEEAIYLFGSIENAHAKTGQIIYITLADTGALILQGDYKTHIKMVRSPLADPVKTDEVFCGVVMANLLHGCHPIFSAQKAGALTTEIGVGKHSSALFTAVPAPDVRLDGRVRINLKQVEKCAQVVKNLPEADPFNFVCDFLPPVNHPNVLDYFFAVTLQQFSFWEDDGRTYTKPLLAQIDGKLLKGSSYLYQAYTRQLLKDPLFFTPERQVDVTVEELLSIFRADDGSDPMPAFDLHLQKTNQYGRDMLALGLTPEKIIARAYHLPTPLKTFIMILDRIGGYKEDPIRKKANLLATCLDARPEKIFQFRASEEVTPVVDYHCMRACLRMGLIDVLDKTLQKKLTDHAIVSGDEEWAIRYAAFLIQEKVTALSEKPVDAIHWFFFNYTRNHCPEMADPVCMECAMDELCAHRKEMFQPVFRTTFY